MAEEFQTSQILALKFHLNNVITVTARDANFKQLCSKFNLVNVFWN